LANTLRLIRENGRKGFYEGVIAGLICEEMEKGNGLISANDLKSYEAIWRKPLKFRYKNIDIITIGPPSGGGILFTQLLGIIGNYNLSQLGFHSPESIHLITEAWRRVFADRAEYSGDPDFVKVPVEELTEAGYLRDRMKDFNPLQATPSTSISHGNPALMQSEETTHYSVVDRWGNAVSTTTTLNGTFGNCIAVKGAGFLLNNEMDDFSVKPGFPNMYGLIGGEANAIAPGKRMLSSMTPVIAEKDGKLYMVLGSPGGSTIPTSVFQVFINVTDFGMNMQQSVDAKRFHHQWLPDQISYEREAFDSTTVQKLESMGHQLKQRAAIGRVNAILINKSGMAEAGADPRGDNTAVSPVTHR
jgi:gamma-glutamyltranspeptidase/glutathione hydrolase